MKCITALVGAAQKTGCFSSVTWLYLCTNDLEVDGDAFETSTVRLDADVCVEEARLPRPVVKLSSLYGLDLPDLNWERIWNA